MHLVERLPQVHEHAVQRARFRRGDVVEQRPHDRDAVRRAAGRAESAGALVQDTLGERGQARCHDLREDLAGHGQERDAAPRVAEAQVALRLGQRDHGGVAPRRRHLAALPGDGDQVVEQVMERLAAAAQQLGDHAVLACGLAQVQPLHRRPVLRACRRRVQVRLHLPLRRLPSDVPQVRRALLREQRGEVLPPSLQARVVTTEWLAVSVEEFSSSAAGPGREPRFLLGLLQFALAGYAVLERVGNALLPPCRDEAADFALLLPAQLLHGFPPFRIRQPRTILQFGARHCHGPYDIGVLRLPGQARPSGGRSEHGIGGAPQRPHQLALCLAQVGGALRCRGHPLHPRGDRVREGSPCSVVPEAVHGVPPGACLLAPQAPPCMPAPPACRIQRDLHEPVVGLALRQLLCVHVHDPARMPAARECVVERVPRLVQRMLPRVGLPFRLREVCAHHAQLQLAGELEELLPAVGERPLSLAAGDPWHCLAARVPVGISEEEHRLAPADARHQLLRSADGFLPPLGVRLQRGPSEDDECQLLPAVEWQRAAHQVPGDQLHVPAVPAPPSRGRWREEQADTSEVTRARRGSGARPEKPPAPV